MDIQAKFNDLRLAAIKLDDAELLDCRELEPLFLEMIQLVRDHPEFGSYFVDQFSKMATSELNAPGELIPYCMRELRIPEVRQAAVDHFNRLMAEGRHTRFMNYMSQISKAYDDFVWDEACMWSHFTQKELTPGVVPTLIERLSNADVDIRWNAVYALEGIGPAASAAIPSLERLSHTDPVESIKGRCRVAIRAITNANDHD